MLWLLWGFLILHQWKTVSSPSKNNLHIVKWIKDSFYAIGSNGTVLKSKDGVNWYKENINLAAFKNADFKDITVVNNKIVIATADGLLIYKDIK